MGKGVLTVGVLLKVSEVFRRELGLTLALLVERSDDGEEGRKRGRESGSG